MIVSTSLLGNSPRVLFHFRHLFVFRGVASFPVNLQHRRDVSFYLCGEVCQFISLLFSRIYTSDLAPLANAWFLLLRFQTSEDTFLAGEEYLLRLKLTNKVSAAGKAKAEGMHFGKKAERPAILATTETVKADFIKDNQQYVQYFINEVLRHTGLTTNIKKGMATFVLSSCSSALWTWLCATLTYCTAPSPSVRGLLVPMSPCAGINTCNCLTTYVQPMALVLI